MDGRWGNPRLWAVMHTGGKDESSSAERENAPPPPSGEGSCVAHHSTEGGRHGDARGGKLVELVDMGTMPTKTATCPARLI